MTLEYIQNNQTESVSIVDKILNRENKTGCVYNSMQNGHHILDEEYGIEIYQDLIYKLIRVHMNTEMAKNIWINIVKHAQELSSKLGRNVGIHVAACDYFLTVNVIVRHPILIEECLLRDKEEGAFRDALTGLFNRRYFNQELPRQVGTLQALRDSILFAHAGPGSLQASERPVWPHGW